MRTPASARTSRARCSVPHVLRLEMAVDDQHVREPLACERGAHVDDDPLKRCLAHADRAVELPRVAGDPERKRRQHERLDLPTSGEHLGRPAADTLGDQAVRRQGSVRAVRLGRSDRPEQDDRPAAGASPLERCGREVGELVLQRRGCCRGTGRQPIQPPPRLPFSPSELRLPLSSVARVRPEGG